MVCVIKEPDMKLFSMRLLLPYQAVTALLLIPSLKKEKEITL